MIIRYHCPAVVMLCDLVEAGRSKCAKYWPDLIGKPQCYGNITVTLVAEERLVADTAKSRSSSIYAPVCRIFEIYSTSENGRPQVMRCRQYQINGWPDHGVPHPSATNYLIDLAALLLQTYPPSAHLLADETQKNPLLVHCSAGCGRTGVFIALHQICALLKLHQLDSNILCNGLMDLVKSLRYQRPSMVQTFDQYVFLYQLVGTLLRRVSRTCLKRLMKMGVVVGPDGKAIVPPSHPQHPLANSPSPPPPKPPDPFGGSNQSLNKPSIESGRLLASEIASELVVPHKTSDWSILRRASRVLSECLKKPTVIQAAMMTSPPPSRNQVVRRASTTETPGVLRRLPTSPNGKKPHGCVTDSEDPFQFDKKIDSVEKQLASLTQQISSPPPQKPRQRPTHRRQLSGSYDNIAELGANPPATTAAAAGSSVSTGPVDSNGTKSGGMISPVVNGDTSHNIMSASIHVDSPRNLAVRRPNKPVVVDLSNMTMPKVSSSSNPKSPLSPKSPLFSPKSPIYSPMISPTPIPPPRRKRLPSKEHHLSVAHLVLNQHENDEISNDLTKSATLGRSSTMSPVTAGSFFDSDNNDMNPIKPLRGSMILPTSSMAASALSTTNRLHFNPVLKQNNQQPHIHHNFKQISNGNGVLVPDDNHRRKASTSDMQSASLPVDDVKGNANMYSSLSRFRSVAELDTQPLPVSAVRSSVDNYLPVATAKTPTQNSPNEKQPETGRSI